jgi:hypothetical protein
MSSSENTSLLPEFLIRWLAEYEGADPISQYVLQPVYNFFNFDNYIGFVVAWGIVIGVYLALYYKAPTSFLNSTDGFIDSRRCVAFALLAYYLIYLFLKFLLAGYAVASKKILKSRYFTGKFPIPHYLKR